MTSLGQFVAQLILQQQYVKNVRHFGQGDCSISKYTFCIGSSKIDELAAAAFYKPKRLALYNEGKLDVETAAALKSF